MAFLNYDQMRYFRAIVTEGDLTMMVQHLKISWPALSVQMRSLEVAPVLGLINPALRLNGSDESVFQPFTNS